MKQQTRIIVVVALTAAASFGLGASFARSATVKALVSVVTDNEALNEVALVESWDRVEQLLAEGCTKEALELVRIEQSLTLLSIKTRAGEDKDRMAKLRARNPDVAKRVESASLGNSYAIPTCKCPP